MPPPIPKALSKPLRNIPTVATLNTFLSTQQSRVLKRLAALTGLGASGTKTELAAAICGAVSRSRLPDLVRRGGGLSADGGEAGGVVGREGAGEVGGASVGEGERKGAAAKESEQGLTRVLSVDMGVKNLAFCVLEVRQDRWKNRGDGASEGRSIEEENGEGSSSRSAAKSAVKIVEWKRLDLTSRLRELARRDAGNNHDSRSQQNDDLSSRLEHTYTSEADVDMATITETDPYTDSDIELIPSTDAAKIELSNMFTPSTLALVAHTLAQDLLSLRPSVILIERQRFRSGGAPQIQEWTVRVNMLEAMLWACLTTLKHSPRYNHALSSKNTISRDDSKRHDSSETEETAYPFPDLVEMNPRRVGSFWLTINPPSKLTPSITPIDVPLELATGCQKTAVKDGPKSGKASLEKKDKIALVRRWVQSSSAEVQVAEDLIAGVAAPFLRGRVGKEDGAAAAGKRGRDRENNLAAAAAGVGKLDDLADCVVQGVTFAVWEENRRRVFEYCGVERVDVAKEESDDDLGGEKETKKGSKRKKEK